jgi:hypothetical protein
MKPVIDALVDLINKGGHSHGLLRVFSYPIANGVRAKAGEEPDCSGLVCLRNDATLHWTVVTAIQTPMGFAVLSALPPVIEETETGKRIGFRQVTAEDLVELDVTLLEVVQHIKDTVQQAFITGMVNVPAASA